MMLQGLSPIQYSWSTKWEGRLSRDKVKHSSGNILLEKCLQMELQYELIQYNGCIINF